MRGVAGGGGAKMAIPGLWCIDTPLVGLTAKFPALSLYQTAIILSLDFR